MTTIVIASPTLADVPIMRKWGKKTPELWGAKTSDFYSKKGLADWVSHPGKDVMLVARVDGKLVGMIMTYVLREWSYCSVLYVDNAYRRMGIGEKLVEATVKKTKELGLDTLELVVHSGNVSAQKFYEKLGFEKGFNLLWMSKRLR